MLQDESTAEVRSRRSPKSKWMANLFKKVKGLKRRLLPRKRISPKKGPKFPRATPLPRPPPLDVPRRSPRIMPPKAPIPPIG